MFLEKTYLFVTFSWILKSTILVSICQLIRFKLWRTSLFGLHYFLFVCFCILNTCRRVGSVSDGAMDSSHKTDDISSVPFPSKVSRLLDTDREMIDMKHIRHKWLVQVHCWAVGCEGANMKHRVHCIAFPWQSLLRASLIALKSHWQQIHPSAITWLAKVPRRFKRRRQMFLKVDQIREKRKTVKLMH